jgi:SAM-dependent methyltransferase
MTALPITFDTIAQQYDALRGHPPAVATQIGAAIVATTGSGATILEIGVGTGRIAAPVQAAGGHVVGIDLAAQMLRVARSKQVDRLIQADMQALPFRSRTFDAVLAVHVLHLASDWRAALREIARVLRSGGAFVQGSDWRDPDSCAGRLRWKLREIVMELLPGARPPGAGAAIGQALAKLGGQPQGERIVATWEARVSPAAVIADMAARHDPETWALDEAILDAAIARLRVWAAATWDDPTRPETIERRFVLNIVRGAWNRSENRSEGE